MRKRIVTVIIVLTAALLIAGAFLPDIAAAVMDASANKKASTAPMQSLELEVISDEVTPESNMRGTDDIIGKLILASRMYTIPISDNEASMTEADVFAAAEQAIADYIAAGIFQWFDVTYSSADPMLGLDAEHPEDYVTFWIVYFENENEPYQTLRLYVDDETGKVFYVQFNNYGTYSMDTVWDDNLHLLDAFTSIYFQHVGLSEAADYARSTGTGVEILETDGGVTCMRYSFGDVIYGEFSIEFYATGAGGFEIYFPAE